VLACREKNKSDRKRLINLQGILGNLQDTNCDVIEKRERREEWKGMQMERWRCLAWSWYGTKRCGVDVCDVIVTLRLSPY